MEPTNAVAFRDVSVRRSGLAILEHVNATVPQGSCTVIVGPNGAGKTTLILALIGEMRHGGAIDIMPGRNGKSLRLGYVPQRISIDRGMPLTVMEFLVMGIQKRPLWLGIRPSLKEHSLGLLAMVKAEHLASRRLGDLSGGEMQRVLLALALQQEPELLVLDEPSAGVDFQGEHLFCELLDELRAAKGFTQLMVSHDLGMVFHHATHVICLKRHVFAEGTPDEVLTQENLMMRLRPNPYGPARYTRGFRMDFSAVRRNETSPLTGHKTLNYGDCILEHRAAVAAGMDERIFLNTRGKLAEGTVSNLFLVSGGRIYTPALSCGLLPGVLRSYLLERYRVEEGEIDPRELENFDECFVTNSLMGVMPVRQLGERVFPSRETADRLRSAYEAEKGTLQ